MIEETASPRRRFLKLASGAAAAMVLLGSLPRRVWAAGLPHLSAATNATAKALKYVEDDTKAPPPHKPGQQCAKCMHYSGKPGDAYGPCAIFPGFDVNAKGWCSGFQAKS